MLRSGANLNARGERGSTPIHEAALQGHAEAVKVLINLGADLGVLNHYSETALEVAFNAGNQDILMILNP